MAESARAAAESAKVGDGDCEREKATEAASSTMARALADLECEDFGGGRRLYSARGGRTRGVCIELGQRQ